jgi:hypothetical protein
MNKTAISPESVYADLLAKHGKNKRSARNLEIIHKICQKVSEGDRDFSPANIGPRSEVEGGPKVNTLYSPLGIKFRILMKAWEDANVTGRRKIIPRTAKRNADIELILDNISDDTTRQQFRILLNDLATLRDENRALEKNLQIARQYGGEKTTLDYRSQEAPGTLQVITPIKTLTESEREALEHLVDSEWLKRRGFAEGPRGELVLKEAGRAILEMGTLTGLRKLLDK